MREVTLVAVVMVLLQLFSNNLNRFIYLDRFIFCFFSHPIFQDFFDWWNSNFYYIVTFPARIRTIMPGLLCFLYCISFTKLLFLLLMLGVVVMFVLRTSLAVMELLSCCKYVIILLCVCVCRCFRLAMCRVLRIVVICWT